MDSFILRMRLWELDEALDVTSIDKYINLAEIDRLVTTGDWPEC